MSLFRTKLLPVLRALGILAAGLSLALVIAYVADRCSDPAPPGPIAAATNAPHAAPQGSRLSEAELREARLYGWGSPSRRRMGELLCDADMCLLADFRTFYLTEFKAVFGSRISQQTLEPPSRENVLEVVMRELTKLPEVKETDTRAVAEYLAAVLTPDRDSRHYYWESAFKAEKHKDGFWSVYSVTDYKESKEIVRNRDGTTHDEKPFRDALSHLPPAYRLYLSSLVAEREQGIADMDSLLALPEPQSKPLRAIAKYRRARLTMSLLDWNKLSDEQARQRLASLRADLTSVSVHAAEGSLDPYQISQNARYWLAYSRSMILPATRLRRMGEADYPGAFAAYLDMPERGDANGVNSCYRLAAHLCDSADYEGCVNDPDLRMLVNLYLCAEGSNGYGDMPENQQLAKQIDGWLDTLTAAKVGYDFDPLRIAILQHRAGRWKDCLATLKRVPADHPMRALLRSRCALRITGDLAKAGQLLAPDADEAALLADLRPGTLHLSASEAHDFTVLADLAQMNELRERVLGERGVVRLVQGDFKEALRLFAAGRYLSESNYVGECLLTVDEMKSVVDQDEKMGPGTTAPVYDMEDRRGWNEHILSPRALLASKLFRAGRLEEATAYLEPKLRSQAVNYVIYRRLAERTDLADRTRADAYWRSARVIGEIGEDILRAPVGLNWTSCVYPGKEDECWYVPYNFLPHHRLNRLSERDHAPVNVLLSASKEEALRLQSWLRDHVEKPVRSERDARYASFDLALKAARLLPDNDPAGGMILQYAGNLLRAREPKAANPAYVLLVTHFKQTPYGEHALKAHWFSKERPLPSVDVISK